MSVRSRRALASLTVLAAGLVGGGLALGVGPVAVTPAAGAATCTSAGGVSVVVDYRELGGSTVTACAPDGGGKSATAIFESVGVTLSYATRQPGFVCRVNGVPTSDPCVNASQSNAFWGLWWGDGSQASWTYSSSGVGSLTVPAGGSVGWSWQQDRPAGGNVPPSVAPPVTHTSTSPSPTPTQSPTTSSPTASPSSGSGSTSPSPTSSPSPTKGGGSGGSGSPGGSSQTSSPSPQVSPSGSPTTPSESPLGVESPSDSRAKAGSRKDSDEASEKRESPSDSPSSKDAETSETAVESPSDSTPSAASDAAPPTPDEPARVPAVITWGIVGLLAIAIATSALVARRRRGL